MTSEQASAASLSEKKEGNIRKTILEGFDDMHPKEAIDAGEENIGGVGAGRAFEIPKVNNVTEKQRDSEQHDELLLVGTTLTERIIHKDNEINVDKSKNGPESKKKRKKDVEETKQQVVRSVSEEDRVLPTKEQFASDAVAADSGVQSEGGSNIVMVYDSTDEPGEQKLNQENAGSNLAVKKVGLKRDDHSSSPPSPRKRKATGSAERDIEAKTNDADNVGIRRLGAYLGTEKDEERNSAYDERIATLERHASMESLTDLNKNASEAERGGKGYDVSPSSMGRNFAEMLEQFGQIELNKDILDSIKRTESAVNFADQGCESKDLARAAFDAAVQVAREQVVMDLDMLIEKKKRAPDNDTLKSVEESTGNIVSMHLGRRALLKAYAMTVLSLIADEGMSD